MDLLRIFALPGDACELAADAELHIWHLRFLTNVVITMKQCMVDGKLDWLSFREHPFHLGLECAPLVLSPKVIGHQKSAAGQVAPQTRHLCIAEVKLATFSDVNEWEPAQVRIS